MRWLMVTGPFTCLACSAVVIAAGLGGCTNGSTCSSDECVGGGGRGGVSGDFEVTATLSPQVGTVAIVEWSVNAAVDSAYIDFGRNPEQFEYQAPVADVKTEGNRTLLLGMKPNVTYSYQIVAVAGDTTYKSDLYEIRTEPIRNGLPPTNVTTESEDELGGGFTLFCTYELNSSGGTWALVLDSDGEIVWWYRSDDLYGCSRARLSFAGEFMWLGNTNTRGGEGSLVRVAMDGSAEEVFSLPDRHHDFLVMPDDHIVTIEYEGGNSRGCDVVTDFDPSNEESATLFTVASADPDAAEGCHSNAINWWPSEQVYTLSVLNWDSIIAFSDGGDIEWVLGGSQSDFADVSWDAQHQHHLIDDTIFLFNNNGTDGGSDVLEYRLDSGVAELVLRHASSSTTVAFGDVKQLDNGNLLITYSNSGIIREISPSGDTVRQITTDPIGYTVRRTSLYGPPPPFTSGE